ncbi:MAG: CRISPR-associated helicase Cas3' [Ferrimonas sp.]
MRRIKNKHNIPNITRAIDFNLCPAKTWQQPNGQVALGHSVYNHCQIVGEIARILISYYPSFIKKQLFPNGAELVAAAHDIGKVSPSFTAKLYQACGINYHQRPELEGALPHLESQWGGHAGVSQACALQLNTPKYIAEIIGQHHGFSPNVADKRGNAEVFGGVAWQHQRQQLVDALKAYFQCDWPQLDNVAQARVLAGLTSVADWIGSGSWFTNPHQPWQEHLDQAIADAGFAPLSIRANLSFAEIFDPQQLQMQPRVAQTHFFNQIDGPGVYILEAQMGMGKTEAALYAAYQLLTKQQANGIYFALPTQLTSNKIYDRFNQFLAQITEPSCPHRALLLHSGAWLVDTELGEEGQPGGAWFNQKKRGLLAPFAVGTIDQALMAVMNVKHGFVRAFGLAGKVVILDEVHSYDLYTSTLLNELVTFLPQVGCSVIILSATLSQSRRTALMQTPCLSPHYPLITARANHAEQATEIAVSVADGHPIMLTHCACLAQALEQALIRAENGEQVLWIENSVAEAQQRYLDLAAKATQMGCEVGLLHSRFTPQHRQQHEQKWVDCFGEAGWPQRQARGRILVGTQVLEQSLDIDADFLISRFAPSDMLLQRIGRLWRHKSTPRAASAQPQCWLLTPQLEEALANPAQAFGASALIYAPYVLCRSLAVWQSLTALNLPSMIRPIIDKTYADRSEQGHWARLLAELQQGTSKRTGEEAQQALARLTLAPAGKTLPESKAETRHSDQATIDVLLVRSIQSQHGQTHVRLLNDEMVQFPHQRHQLSAEQWRQKAMLLHQQLVRVSPANSPDPMPLEQLQKWHLQHLFYLGDPTHGEAVLRLAIVDDAGDLRTPDGGAPAAKNTHLAYRTDLGYRNITHLSLGHKEHQW